MNAVELGPNTVEWTIKRINNGVEKFIVRFDQRLDKSVAVCPIVDLIARVL